MDPATITKPNLDLSQQFPVAERLGDGPDLRVWRAAPTGGPELQPVACITPSLKQVCASAVASVAGDVRTVGGHVDLAGHGERRRKGLCVGLAKAIVVVDA